ncbi:DNA helicase IV [Actinoplanes campanulatus]|uniref:DNA helicase IV n=1 Tax=Actinoplanes campanulatus TaxID=113559 RepID=A0A7W5FJ31_9ACTN|nr:AAA family ATPase [Actinoplanes campanulatus]MBB3100075.1 DNA helicase IV [Actinoplanes campanulatus]GGN29114.1 DNA helicase [Actinoplanes campanulatus]GID38944.1 DNA helicase [Actinoplanes campanulatus]
MSDTTVLQQEIAVEQQHVDRVYARLAELRRDASRAEKEGYRLAGVGTFGALVERDAMVFHAARRRHALDTEYEGLVFGRLDLKTGATHYVGRMGIRDDGSKPLVVDWRAPAAAAFYRATPAEPLGVVRRRMIQSSRERVTGIEDDLLDPEAAPDGMRVVGDGALLASLAKATGRGMRDIVATIQREQDEAIRSPASGVTIVTGGPGTGKTAVALHRAAYLLYSDRSRFAGGGILVVGPSGVFVEYIATVLPSLGEETATLRSLGSLVPGYDATRVDSGEVAAIKGSLRMRRVLERASHDAVPGAPTELRLLYRGTLLRLDAQALDQIRRKVLQRGARRNEVRGHGFDRVFDALWAQAREARVTGLPEKKEFESELADRTDFREFLKAWWPRFTPMRVLRWLADPGRLRAYANGLLSRDEIAALQGSFDALGEHGPTISDVALLDELDELMGRPRQPQRKTKNPFHVRDGIQEVSTFADRQAAARAQQVRREEDYREFAHVVVDESQDVTPMQWRMIGRRGQYASWTIVGDPAQTAWSGDLDELDRARDRALGSRKRNSYALTTNYRNSSEIFEVAARVIRTIMPDLPLPSAVRSTGVEPADVSVTTGGLPEAVRELTEKQLAEVDGTIGVIMPVPRHDEVAGWVAGLPERVQVVTALEAKGMEYDAVVLVEPSQIATDPAGVRTLYVALSRATQRLTTVGTNPGWLP